MLAPRLRACSSDSITNIPAPSAGTNPSLFKSKGLLAVAGLSFCVLKARRALNPPNPNLVIPDSQPPAKAMSHIPLFINRAASPID